MLGFEEVNKTSSPLAKQLRKVLVNITRNKIRGITVEEVKDTENHQRPARTLSESFLVLQLTCTLQVHTGIGVNPSLRNCIQRGFLGCGCGYGALGYN